jgi:hypothetical protein
MSWLVLNGFGVAGRASFRQLIASFGLLCFSGCRSGYSPFPLSECRF